MNGRRKFIIKQKGYNIFPADVGEHLVNLDGVEQVEGVGVKHTLFDEEIFAFVKLSRKCRLSASDMNQHYKSIASYKRPQNIEVWDNAIEFPLTRSVKVDKLALQKIAMKKVEALRIEGKWELSLKSIASLKRIIKGN